jgi:hypothetical protein
MQKMSKKDDFKNFVSKHPNLVTIVKNKTHTWQDLYEVYDLYGEDESLWDKYLNNQNVNSSSSGLKDASNIGELTKLFKNINIDNVQRYIDTAQKAISVIQELTGAGAGAAAAKAGPDVARPINKIFED